MRKWWRLLLRLVHKILVQSSIFSFPIHWLDGINFQDLEEGIQTREEAWVPDSLHVGELPEEKHKHVILLHAWEVNFYCIKPLRWALYYSTGTMKLAFYSGNVHSPSSPTMGWINFPTPLMVSLANGMLIDMRWHDMLLHTLQNFYTVLCYSPFAVLLSP